MSNNSNVEPNLNQLFESGNNVTNFLGSTKFNHGGVKLVHELMIDIMGSMIPGVLFIFSIIVCLVLPCVICMSVFPKENAYTDSFYSIFDGWFWVVSFFTFLILSYIAGHVFYRSDIRKADKANVQLHMRNNISILLNEFSIDWTRKEKDKEKNKEKNKEEEKHDPKKDIKRRRILQFFSF